MQQVRENPDLYVSLIENQGQLFQSVASLVNLVKVNQDAPDNDLECAITAQWSEFKSIVLKMEVNLT